MAQFRPPTTPGGEGLGWKNHVDGCEFSALGVTLPRLDDHRKEQYNMKVTRYVASTGECRAIDDVTGEEFNLIDEASARCLRAASIAASNLPEAKIQPIGLEFVSLQPGERAVLPVRWTNASAKPFECSTHPHAPAGLTVFPGECPPGKEMSCLLYTTDAADE